MSYERATVKYESDGPKEISYIKAGPSQGPLLIFIHGWPGVAYTWKPQIDAFSALGFHVVAPDMPGYGASTANKVKTDYTHENIINGLLALLAATGRSQAVWLAHDWGAGVLSSLMATHPEVFKAACLMTIPYKSLELGLDTLVSLVNRDIYPEKEYPWGQWDYQAFYEQSFDQATEFFDADPEAWIRFLFQKQDVPSAGFGKPAFTATVVRDKGWLGGMAKLPEEWRKLPSSNSILGEEVTEDLVAAMKKTGFYGGDAYYSNHKANYAFNMANQKNGGYFTKPLLFIEAQWDGVCDTALSRLAEPMKEFAERLTYVSIASGHWVNAEKALETNAAIAAWLTREVPEFWPYYFNNRHVRNF